MWNRTSKHLLHFLDDVMPFLRGMLGLHVDIFGRMTDETVGIGNILSMTGLKVKGIGR